MATSTDNDPVSDTAAVRDESDAAAAAAAASAAASAAGGMPGQTQTEPASPPDIPTPSLAAALMAPSITSAGRVFPALPHTTGPYWTGIADIEWADAAFEQSGEVAGKPTPQGILVRLYYPAARKANGPIKNAPKCAWLPSWRYAVGYGMFLKLPAIINYTVMTILKAFDIPDAYADVPLESSENSRRPVLIFSPGLGGMRTTYSATCNELASYGWVVAALEHRDGSASLAMADGGKTQIHLRPLPPNTDEFAYRNGQVEHRARECVKAVELLRMLDAGAPFTNAWTESRFDCSSLRGRLDFDRLAIAGHSFGVGTAVTACARYPEVGFRCAVLHDGWLFPVNEQELIDKVTMPPMLFANTHTFQWTDNVERMRRWVKRDPTGKSLIMAVLGTAHQNNSDFPMLIPSLLQRLDMAGPLDPFVAQGLFIRATMAFIHATIPEEGALPDWYHVDSILNSDREKRPQEVVLDTDEGGVPVDLGKWK